MFDSVKILGYTYNDKESNIKMQEYQRTRMNNGNKEKEEPVQVMNIPENRCGQLTIHYELSIDEPQEDKTTKVRTKRYSKNIKSSMKTLQEHPSPP